LHAASNETMQRSLHSLFSKLQPVPYPVQEVPEVIANFARLNVGNC
jgi:hypothetical protein